jgi:hypothetical protein
MIPFNFSFGSGAVVQIFILVLWLVYMALYWRGLVLIMKAGKFDSTDKMLWFLVITMAPVIGLITFHAMCPPHLRELGTEGKPTGDS